MTATLVLGLCTLTAGLAGCSSASSTPAAQSFGDTGPLPLRAVVSAESAIEEAAKPSAPEPVPVTLAAFTSPGSVFGERRRGIAKVGKPYVVAGRTYVPRHDPDYDEVGEASWYGPAFHGKPTANGETYNQGRLTAAHPTLPLPSYVEVTNLANKRKVLVRVNDRGPYKHGRIIDLSHRAAKLLGYLGQGTAHVRVRYVGPAPVGGDDSYERAFLARQSWFGSDVAEAARDTDETASFTAVPASWSTEVVMAAPEVEPLPAPGVSPWPTLVGSLIEGGATGASAPFEGDTSVRD